MALGIRHYALCTKYVAQHNIMADTSQYIIVIATQEDLKFS